MRTLLLLALLALLAPVRPLRASDDYPKRSPFTAVRSNGDDYEVELDGAWYRLVSIDGIDAARIRAFCDERYGARSEKRFAEDLVQVLSEMEHPPGERVDLELESLERDERDERVTRRGVAMTEANRRSVWSARNEARVLRVERVEREHARAIPPELADLARPLRADAFAGSPSIARADAGADLDQLEWEVERRFAYRDLLGLDVRALFDAVRAGLPESMPLASFAVQVERLVARFGDGHGGVRGFDAYLPRGFLPFLLAESRDGIVAFASDRSGFVDPERPYVLSIDGRPIDAWIELARTIVPVASDSTTRFRALRELRAWNFARAAAGSEPFSAVELVLAREGGGDPRTLRLELAGEKPIYGPWPRRASGMRADGVAYLRIDSMEGDAGAIEGIERALDDFAGARALVIDLRGNGGGTRDALRAVMPRLMARDAAPLVVNVAAYRLATGEPRERAGGWLADRALFPTDDPRWSKEERRAIQGAMQRFRPDWTPPRADFSAWHVALVAPDASDRPRFDALPVALLADEACFSATDVFLGALELLPNVTLVGAPSGGGSGRAHAFELAKSGLRLRLATMASFRPSGVRYDGRGVEPDRRVRPLASDFLEGGTDAVLDAALAELASRR